MRFKEKVQIESNLTSQKKAVTILEMLIGIAILSFIILPIIHLFRTSQTASIKAIDVATATEMAASLIELMKGKPTGYYPENGCKIEGKKYYNSLLGIMSKFGDKDKAELSEEDIQTMLIHTFQDLPTPSAINRFKRTLIIEALGKPKAYLTPCGVQKQPSLFRITVKVKWVNKLRRGKKPTFRLITLVENKNPPAFQ